MTRSLHNAAQTQASVLSSAPCVRSGRRHHRRESPLPWRAQLRDSRERYDDLIQQWRLRSNENSRVGGVQIGRRIQAVAGEGLSLQAEPHRPVCSSVMKGPHCSLDREVPCVDGGTIELVRRVITTIAVIDEVKLDTIANILGNLS